MSRVAGLTTSAPGAGAVAPTVVVTVAPVADQLTLATISPTVSATSNAVAATITAYAWTVSGPATIADDTTATPTITPTGGGVIGIACAVTVGGIVYRSAVDTLTVGDADGKVQRHHADWAAAGSAVDFSGATTSKTIDGLQYDRYMPGTVNSFAATEGVGLSIDPNSADAGVRIAGNALSVGVETDVVYYAALAAGSLDNDGDQLSLIVACASGAFGTVYARRSGGVQQLGTFTAGGEAQETTAGGAQVRQLAYRIRGYQVEGYYSEEAFSGTFPALSEMTKVTTAPAGFFVLDNHHGGDTSDSRVPASDLFYWLVPIASTGPVVITNTEIRY